MLVPKHLSWAARHELLFHAGEGRTRTKRLLRSSPPFPKVVAHVYMSQFWAPTKISTTKRHHYELLHSRWRIPRIDPLSRRAQTASLLSTNHHQVGRSIVLRHPRPVRNAGDHISNASDFDYKDETSRQGQYHVLMRPKDQVRQKIDPE